VNDRDGKPSLLKFGGATRNAPLIGLSDWCFAAQHTLNRHPMLWATRSGGSAQAPTAHSRANIQSSSSGLLQSEGCNRNAPGDRACHNVCQCSGPEPLRPGKNRRGELTIKLILRHRNSQDHAIAVERQSSKQVGIDLGKTTFHLVALGTSACLKGEFIASAQPAG
jgi:hypothetical protein